MGTVYCCLRERPPREAARVRKGQEFMPQEPVPMTKEGVAKLQEELESLKADRKVVADHIHKARELGTSQNDAEYDNAKQEQSLLEGKILNVEDLLRRAVIIDEEGAHHASRVVVGSGVKVRQGRKTLHYQIVGPPEANASQGRISNESPIGAALLGRSKGEEVEITVPSGTIKLKVLDID